MKIYFDGCSFTWGDELEDNYTSRYSRLLCNHFGAEEYNIAKRGGSNRRIVRNILEHDISQYDLFIIQMTKKQRTEYYSEDDNKWKAVSHTPWEPERSYDVWNDYYKNIYQDEYGKVDELMYYTILRNHLRDVPHRIIWFGNYNMTLPVDIKFPKGSYTKAEKGHPDENGHKKICQDLLDIL